MPTHTAPFERLQLTINAYDRAPEEYAARYRSVDTAHLRDGFLGKLPSLRGPVLDAGCGTGRDLAGFSHAGATVIGVDLSAGLLAEAARHCGTNRLIRCDFRELPLRSESMCGVWSMASLVHLDHSSVVRALSEFRRVLTRDGVVFASIASGTGDEWRPSPYGQHRWFHYYTESEIQEMAVEADLALVSLTTEPGSVGGLWSNALLRRSH